jgi:hypothetical protein
MITQKYTDCYEEFPYEVKKVCHKAKSNLNEAGMTRGYGPLPTAKITAIDGPSHMPKFTGELQVE